MSQRQFAAAIHVPLATLQNWEQGRNQPDNAVLSLMVLFDQSPERVRRAVFDTTSAPVAETA